MFYILDNHIKYDMFEYFCDALQYIPELEELWMGGNKIGDKGLLFFTPQMKYLKSIKMIDVSSNNITHESFAVFIISFGQCEKLQDVFVMSINNYYFVL